MSWQNQFDTAFEQCRSVAAEIQRRLNKFEEYENKHDLFYEYLKARRNAVGRNKDRKQMDILGSLQILIGMPILGLIVGFLIFLVSPYENGHPMAWNLIIGGAIVGFVVGIILLFVIPNAKQKNVESEAVKGFSYDPMQMAIIEKQQALIDEQDALITGKWATAYANFENILKTAPSGSLGRVATI